MKRLYAPHMLYGYAASAGLVIYATISGAGSYDCGKTSEIPLTECQALVELYDATEGDAWVGHVGWLTSTSPCSWQGITCNSGHITHIDLTDNNMVGKIPGAIENLSKLQMLNLSYNQLTHLPDSFGKLSSLKELYLYTNKLASLPDSFGNLKSLSYLDMYDNGIKKLPESFANLTSIAYIDLYGNKLEELPEDIGKLQALRFLGLANNRIKKLPAGITQLPNLTELRLENNCLLTDQISDDIETYIDSVDNLWRLSQQKTCPVDAVEKPKSSSSLKSESIRINEEPVVVKPVKKKETDATCELEKSENFRACTISTDLTEQSDIVANLLCENFVTDTTVQDLLRKNIVTRWDIMVMATLLGKHHPEVDVPAGKTFTDVASNALYDGQSFPDIIQTALKRGIVSSERTTLQYAREATRIEAYAMLMNAVCLAVPPEEKTADWQKDIHKLALKNGLTSREWEKFGSAKTLKVYEFFVLASRTADWAQKTGGCKPIPAECVKE